MRSAQEISEETLEGNHRPKKTICGNARTITSAKKSAASQQSRRSKGHRPAAVPQSFDPRGCSKLFGGADELLHRHWNGKLFISLVREEKDELFHQIQLELIITRHFWGLDFYREVGGSSRRNRSGQLPPH